MGKQVTATLLLIILVIGGTSSVYTKGGEPPLNKLSEEEFEVYVDEKVSLIMELANIKDIEVRKRYSKLLSLESEYGELEKDILEMIELIEIEERREKVSSITKKMMEGIMNERNKKRTIKDILADNKGKVALAGTTLVAGALLVNKRNK